MWLSHFDCIQLKAGKEDPQDFNLVYETGIYKTESTAWTDSQE